MYDPTQFPPDHPVQLWVKTRALLHERVGHAWQLLYGPDFNTAGLMKPNECLMQLNYIPRIDDQMGKACMIAYPTLRMTKAFAEYLAKVHKSALPKPKNDPDTLQLGLYRPDGNPLDVIGADIDELSGSFMLATVVGIQTPQGPVLYDKLAPWYIESAEAICNFMHQAYLWNKDNGTYPLLSQDGE